MYDHGCAFSGEDITDKWCQQNGGVQLINTSHYHGSLGVEVPAWTDTTKWTADLSRFDHVPMAMWTFYQVRCTCQTCLLFIEGRWCGAPHFHNVATAAWVSIRLGMPDS